MGQYPNSETNSQLLFLASENYLVAYDIENNSEKFSKEISEGVSVLTFGNLGGWPNGPLLIAGGNMAI